TAYEVFTWLEFRRVLFRSPDRESCEAEPVRGGSGDDRRPSAVPGAPDRAGLRGAGGRGGGGGGGGGGPAQPGAGCAGAPDGRGGRLRAVEGPGALRDAEEARDPRGRVQHWRR